MGKRMKSLSPHLRERPSDLDNESASNGASQAQVISRRTAGNSARRSWRHRLQSDVVDHLRYSRGLLSDFCRTIFLIFCIHETTQLHHSSKGLDINLVELINRFALECAFYRLSDVFIVLYAPRATLIRTFVPSRLATR